MEGRRKASIKTKTNLTFAIYNEGCTEDERMAMDKIINEANTWPVVDWQETSESTFLNEEDESTYRLLYQKVIKDPKNTIADIEAVIAKHPDEYLFHNLLPIAYAALGDKKKEYETVASTYKLFPEKLFAFTNYLMSFGDPDNRDNHVRPIDGDFDFHKFFPEKHNLSRDELLSLTGALFFYFTEELKEYNKGIAYVMPLCEFIFHKHNRKKANQILLFASHCMLQEITKRKGLDEEMNEEMDEKMD